MRRMLDVVRTISPTAIVDVDKITLAKVSAIVCGKTLNGASEATRG